MDQQNLLLGILEGLTALVVVPWCVWVTASIFAQKTQTAIMKEQLNAVTRMEGILIAALRRQGDKD